MGQERVIVLLDMDCFYVQVEQRDKPELKGKPCAVVQYRPYKGGGIIAVSYEARDHGVKRGSMGDDAKKLCPEINLVRVPVQRDKADLTKYREAGAEVINVLMQFSKKVERASIDEAFIDLTDQVEARLDRLSEGFVLPEMLPFTHVAGWEDSSTETDGPEQRDRSKEDIRKANLSRWLNGLDSETDRRLAVGALITEEMRAAVLKQTQFHCSAGIAHNKMLAKLSCGLNKPRKQSVLPQNCVPVLFRDLPIGKVRGLGGKLGTAVTESLGVINMGDLVQYPEAELQARFGPKAGVWLYSICRGCEDDPVRPRQLPKSVGCSKNFLGKSCLDTVKKVKFWIGQLAEEVAERLEKEENLNNRLAKSMCVHVRQMGKPMNGISRSCGLHTYDAPSLARSAMSIIQGLNQAGSHQAAWTPALVNLGISTTKFVDVPQHRGDNSSLNSYFSSQAAGSSKTTRSRIISPKPMNNSTSKPGIESYFSKRGSRKLENVERNSKEENPKVSDECNDMKFTNSDQNSGRDGAVLHSKQIPDHVDSSTVVDASSSKGQGIEIDDVWDSAIESDGHKSEDDLLLETDPLALPSFKGSTQTVSRKDADKPSNISSSRTSNVSRTETEEATPLRRRPLKAEVDIRNCRNKSALSGKGFFKQRIDMNHAMIESPEGDEPELAEDVSVRTRATHDQTTSHFEAGETKGNDSQEPRKGFFRHKTDSSHSMIKPTGADARETIQDVDNRAEQINVQTASDFQGTLDENNCKEPTPGEVSDYFTCDQCRAQVSAWDLPEHLDFHMAQRLQESENGVTRSVAGASGNEKRNGKRKALQSGSAAKKSKSDPSNRTLHSFFGQR